MDAQQPLQRKGISRLRERIRRGHATGNLSISLGKIRLTNQINMSTTSKPQEEETATPPAVVTVSQINTIEKFTDTATVDAILEAHEIELRAFVPNTSTKKGRDEIASFAYKFRKSKTAFDDAGKALIEDAQGKVKAVNVERKRAKETFDRQAVEARKPLTDWEDEKEQQLLHIRSLITGIEAYVPLATENPSADHMKSELAELEKIEIGEQYGDLETEAHRSKDAAVLTLKDMIAKKVKAEGDEADLERLRAAEVETKRKAGIIDNIDKIPFGVDSILERVEIQVDINRRTFMLSEAIDNLGDYSIDKDVFAEFVDIAESEKAKGIAILKEHLEKHQAAKLKIETDEAEAKVERERVEAERVEKQAEARNNEIRIDAIKKRIEIIKLMVYDPADEDQSGTHLTSDQIIRIIDKLDDTEIDELFGEFQAQALTAKKTALSDLEVMLKNAFEREAAKKEADETAEAKRIEDAKEEERELIAAETKKTEDATAEREADEAHRKKIHNEIEEDCRNTEGAVSTAIIEGRIRNLEIKY